LLPENKPPKPERAYGDVSLLTFLVYISIILIILVDPVEILVSIVLLAIGVPIYLYFSPKEELAEVKRRYWSEDAVLRRACRQGRTFLAFPLQKLKLAYYRMTKQSPALRCENKDSCQESDRCKPI